MAKSDPIYKVVISGIDVSIVRLDERHKGYAEASENVILRERDAIEIYRKNRDAGESHDGTYSFHTLENAKSFALLQLKTIEQAVEDNLDRVQAFSD